MYEEWEQVKVRFRAKAGELTKANLHYYVGSKKNTVDMKKVDSGFYAENGYDSSKVEFWEGIIPAGKEVKYYHFEAISEKNGTPKTAWIGAGTGNDGRGISDKEPSFSDFSIVPNYKTSDWSKESIFYQIMVDRFRDGDSSNNKNLIDFSRSGEKPEVSIWGSPVTNGNETDKIWNNQFFGGDLIGVREAIPYLKNTLGVNALYLMPIFQSDSDHKYDNDTYKYVDNNFGGNKGLADLGSELDKEKINYILDGVFNHTAVTGSLYNEKRDEIYFRGDFKDGSGNSISYYPWHGYSNFAKLDYSKAATKKYIYENEDSVAKTFLKKPYYADGWRLDAAEDLNTEPRDFKENNQESEEQKANNLKIWKDFHDNVRKVNKDCFILGEFWGNNSQWYYGNAWDGKMNYGGFYLPFIENSQNQKYYDGKQSLDNKGDYSVAEIASYARDNMKNFPYPAVLNSTNSISTHDRKRFLNQEYSGKGNIKMMTLAQTLQLTFVGIPMIYYGDEIGTFGDKGGNDPYNRQTFNWNDDEWNYDILNNYRNLISARKNNKDAFVYGAFEEIKSDKDNKYLVYARYGKNNRAIVMLNNNGNTSNTTISLKDLDRYGFKNGDVLVDVLSGNQITVKDTSLELPTSGMAAACYVLEDHAAMIKKLDKNFNVNTGLLDLSDKRKKLSEAENVFFTKKGDDTVVTFSLKKEKGQKEVLIRVTDKNESKIEKDMVLRINQKSVTIKSLPEDCKIFVRVIADRDLKEGEVKDIYRDSKYVEAAAKKDKPTGGTSIPGNPSNPGSTGGIGGTVTPSNPGSAGGIGGMVTPGNPGASGSTGGTSTSNSSVVQNVGIVENSNKKKIPENEQDNSGEKEKDNIKSGKPNEIVMPKKHKDSQKPNADISNSSKNVKANLDKLPSKNRTIKLTAKFAKKLLKKMKKGYRNIIILKSNKLVKEGLKIKMSRGFLKKLVNSDAKKVIIDVKRWHIPLGKKKLKSLYKSSNEVAFTIREIRAKKLILPKNYKAIGTALAVNVKSLSIKTGKKEKIKLPVIAMYSSYKKNLVILKKISKKKFKPVKNSKLNKDKKIITVNLKLVRQTLVLAVKNS